VDTILLKAAQAEDSLADGFMRLTRARQNEMDLLQRRFEQTKSGLQEDTGGPLKILERVLA